MFHKTIHSKNELIIKWQRERRSGFHFYNLFDTLIWKNSQYVENVLTLKDYHNMGGQTLADQHILNPTVLGRSYYIYITLKKIQSAIFIYNHHNYIIFY